MFVPLLRVAYFRKSPQSLLSTLQRLYNSSATRWQPEPQQLREKETWRGKELLRRLLKPNPNQILTATHRPKPLTLTLTDSEVATPEPDPNPNC